MARLLVSVRSVAEARAALAGGASLLDVKEPSRGSLGQADPAVVAAVIDLAAGRVPVSAAMGELDAESSLSIHPSLAYAKWGLAGWQLKPRWRATLKRVGELLREGLPECRLVAVGYADWQRANAPEPARVVDQAVTAGCGALLVDTWGKDGTNLLDWIDFQAVSELVHACREVRLPVALAGSLGILQIERLMALEPDWFAVRGAACRGGDRLQSVSVRSVRFLAELVAGDTFEITPSSRGRES
jgi:(5-formylfuran-3-yl)methyl phosphate synthase